jgi:RNA polymerase sigma-70 factor (ECF subfamily)
MEELAGPQIDALIARVRAGQREEYAEIIRRYQSDVWRAAAAMLASVEETEEVVQQVFVRVFFALDQYRAGEDFGVWIRSIARNCVRDRLRAASRESRRLLAYRDRLLAEEDDAAALHEEKRRHEALKKCFQELPTRQREILQLHYHQDLKFAEVANRLGSSAQAVRRTASRVRMTLRECIQRRLAAT